MGYERFGRTGIPAYSLLCQTRMSDIPVSKAGKTLNFFFDPRNGSAGKEVRREGVKTNHD